MALSVHDPSQEISELRRAIAYLLLIGCIWLGSAAASAKNKKPHVLRMQATAYSKDTNLTASGTVAREGIVAADPAILPLGSRIRITRAGPYNGVYIVTDTGGKIGGSHIDIYVPSVAEAKRFGRKVVTVRVLETGTGKADAREKDTRAGKR